MVEEVLTELVDRDDPVVVPHVGQDDAGRGDGVDVVGVEHGDRAIPTLAALCGIIPPVVEPMVCGRQSTLPPTTFWYRSGLFWSLQTGLPVVMPLK
ncbi:hypothetical protein [Georgenia sp. AZ-5]|uniref:hypothetical protein n=1 Tax=Georgenia sp. AZ-5 TaxID=3367526 RepID=UPI0037544A68